MKTILFSESKEHYVALGLEDIPGYSFVFDVMKNYNSIDFDDVCCFVCSFYTVSHNALITLQCREKGVKTILISDGIYDFANSFSNPMQTKYDLVLYETILQDYFVVADKLASQYFNSYQLKRILNYLPARMINRNKPLALPSIPNVLITVANSSYFDEVEFDTLSELYVGIANLLYKENINFSFRLFDSRLFERISLSIDFPVFNDVEAGFEDILYKYSSVILTPSSISITSMFHNRSVFTLCIRTSPIHIQTGWIGSCLSSFERSLEGFINHDISRMKQQRMLLKGYLSTNTINDVILEVLNDNDTFVGEGDLAHENQMLKKMLMSKFNFNVEYSFRVLYQKLKKLSFIRYLRVRIKW